MSTIVVITSAMLRVEVEAGHWVSEGIRSGDVVQYRTRLFDANDTTRSVAEFPDVHAIWHKDKGELITYMEPDDE